MRFLDSKASSSLFIIIVSNNVKKPEDMFHNLDDREFGLLTFLIKSKRIGVFTPVKQGKI